jgi:hypothetical protein
MAYTLVVDKNEYDLPLDYTVKQWVQMSNAAANPDFMISIGMNMPIDKVSILPEKTKVMTLALLNSILQPEWRGLTKKIDNGELIDFNTITLGDFIDLEVYIENYKKHFPNIVGKLYQVDNPEECLISQTQPAVEYYLKWRMLLYKQYSNLFGMSHVNDEADDIQQNKRENPARIWFDIVMVLADDKFLNMDEVLNKPLIQSLNWLAWNKDKKLKEAEQLRKQR